MTQISVPDGQSISYSYDLAGNRTGMTTPAGTTTYTYDGDNRLTGLNAPNVGAISFGYHTAGNQTQRMLPNGVTLTYGYDTLERLTSVNEAQGTTTLASYTYTLDTAGNRTQVANADGSQTIWTYDKAARLVGAAQFDASGAETAQTSYGYDGVGNRLAMASGGQTTTYSYNSLDELTDTSGTSSATYTYDDADRQTGASVAGGPASPTATMRRGARSARPAAVAPPTCCGTSSRPTATSCW